MLGGGLNSQFYPGPANLLMALRLYVSPKCISFPKFAKWCPKHLTLSLCSQHRIYFLSQNLHFLFSDISEQSSDHGKGGEGVDLYLAPDGTNDEQSEVLEEDYEVPEAENKNNFTEVSEILEEDEEYEGNDFAKNVFVDNKINRYFCCKKLLRCSKTHHFEHIFIWYLNYCIYLSLSCHCFANSVGKISGKSS